MSLAGEFHPQSALSLQLIRCDEQRPGQLPGPGSGPFLCDFHVRSLSKNTSHPQLLFIGKEMILLMKISLQICKSLQSPCNMRENLPDSPQDVL